MKQIKCFNKVLCERMGLYEGNKKEWFNPSNWENTNKVIYIALLHPKKTEKELWALYNEIFHETIQFETFQKVIKDVYLNEKIQREYIKAEVECTTEGVRNILSGNNKGMKEWKNYCNKLFEKAGRRKVLTEKYLVIYMLLIDSELSRKEYSAIVQNLNRKACKNLLLRMNREFKKSFGIKTDTNSVINSTRKVLEDIRNTEVKTEIQNKDLVIQELQNQIEEYKNAMEVLETMLDEIKENTEEIITEEREGMLRQFFVSLNAKEYGNILDKLEEAIEVFNLNRTDIMKNQRHLMPMAMLVRQLYVFVKAYGIKPIDKKGRVFTGVCEDIETMNYEGESFQEGELKKLQIKSPGWKYQDTIISIPCVQQVNEGE